MHGMRPRQQPSGEEEEGGREMERSGEREKCE